MIRQRSGVLVGAVIAMMLAAQGALPARAQSYCPQGSSIYGTVVDVHPEMVTIHTSENALGDIHVLTRGARVHGNGLALAPGVYAGVYGCLGRRRREFRAREITLATSANTYTGYHRRATTLEGRVDQVQVGRVLIDSSQRHGDLWVYTSRNDLKTGELIRVNGSFDPMNSAFVATSVAVVKP